MKSKRISKKTSIKSLKVKIKAADSVSELKKLQVLLYFSTYKIVDIQFISAITGLTVAKINNIIDGHADSRNKDSFTSKEKKLIKLLSKGKTNKEIGKAINRSFRSVEKIRDIIIKKAGVKNTAELIMYALKNNLVS